MSECSNETAACMEDLALFEAAIGFMPCGFSLWDEDFRLSLFNRRFLEIYHLPPEKIAKGMALRDLCAVALAARGQHDVSLQEYYEEVRTSFLAHEAGEETLHMERQVWGRTIRISIARRPGIGWLINHEDVTEAREQLDALKVREAELELQNNRFSAAVENMAHGLAMYDADERLVICNGKYQELYGLPDELTRPGTTFHDIINCIMQAGLVPKGSVDEDTSAFVRMLKESASSVVINEMENGKSYSIVDELTDEGGWVSIHQDVTEERARMKALKVREKELRVQNTRFEAAVRHLAQGLVMFDAQHRLVICNDQYASLYGLPEELSRPGTPFEDIIAHRVANGMVPKSGSDKFVEDITRLITERGCFTEVTEMANGRFISINHQPISSGGWVSTHEDVTQRHKNEEKIRYLARHDALTGLPNRTYFNEELKRIGSRIRRGECMAVLGLDLDRFKDINDTLGHGVGDEVLRAVAERLTRAVREHEMVVRLGGDEFVLLLGPLDGPEQASMVAQRILDDFNEPMKIEGHQLTVGTSIGIAVAPKDGTDGETLIKNADRALYRAKANGRGGFQYFEKKLDADIHRRQSLEADLKKALPNGEFSLTYQPVLELESNRVRSCEVLINWDHPRLGWLLSKDFVQLAQEIGINRDLVRWVIEKACKAAVSWPDQVRLSINLTALQFGQSTIVDMVKWSLEKSGLEASRLEIGIGECLLVNNTSQTLKILRQLRELGVRLSLDQFGRENSSLHHLRLFSFDKIILDPSFVRDISQNQNNREIAKAVIGLGVSLGIEMSANGVEDEEQLDFLRDAGCGMVQGNLFSPALPESSIGDLLRTVESRAAREAGVCADEFPFERVMDL